MRSKIFVITAITTSFLSISAFAQDNSANNVENSVEKSEITQDEGKFGKRTPIDLNKYSRMDELKSADTNGDGQLSRDEIEALALQRIVKRAADRMERRLDINGDGKVTLDEIQKQREKEFAVLDRNEDGTLDRKELRAAGKFHGKGDQHSKRHHAKGNFERGHHKAPAQ